MDITVQAIGRLTRDPDTSSTPGGKTVTRLRLASDRRDRDAAPVYVDVVVWEKLGEACAQHLGKGRQVAVQGRLDYREWKTDDGSLRSKHEIVANQVLFLARPQNDSESDNSEAT